MLEKEDCVLLRLEVNRQNVNVPNVLRRSIERSRECLYLLCRRVVENSVSYLFSRLTWTNRGNQENTIVRKIINAAEHE